MTAFRRYVAIGDSATEGLQDFDESGTYRGWADRLAEHIAAAQEQPLEYANLGIRGLRLGEIRRTQLRSALELEPDLLTVTGGVNDVISPRPDFSAVASDYRAIFSAATDRDIVVATFLMPDPTFLNPLGRYVRRRMLILNDIVRDAALRTGARVLDLSRYAVASDPRLWYEDGLHGNRLGHQRMAAGFAQLLGLSGFEDWADPLPDPPPQPHGLQRVSADLDWAVHWLGPWVGRGVTHVPHGRGLGPKRPTPAPLGASRRD